MPEVQDGLRYSEDHEWVKKENGELRYGITDYAQEELGDIVYVELPTVDEKIEKGDMFGVVESVKTVSDLYSPVSGTIKEVNQDLEGGPGLINEDPFGEGWIAIIEYEDESELETLLSAEEYELHIE